MAKKNKNRNRYQSASYNKKENGYSKANSQRQASNRNNNVSSSSKSIDKYKTTNSSKTNKNKSKDFTRTSKYKTTNTSYNKTSNLSKDLHRTNKYKSIDELSEEKINSMKKDLDRLIENKKTRASNKNSDFHRTNKYKPVNTSYNKTNTSINKDILEDNKTITKSNSSQLLKDRLMQELNNPKEQGVKSKQIETHSLNDKQTPPKKKRKLRKNVKLIIALLAFLASVLLILLYFAYHNEAKHQPKKVKEAAPIIEEKDPKIAELEKLYQENNDLVGWIKIDGTKIDYPVVYTKGEDYYLRRDFYKNDYEAGTLMVDKFNTVTPRDTNLIIHGHNMNDGTMFHDLLNYKKESYYQEHKKITYYTLEEKQEYEIMAVFLSKVYRVKDQVFKYYKFYNATNEEEYNYYIDNIKKLSLYDTGINSCFNNELITLSTCEYSQANGRLVVVARKVSENNNCQ